MRAGRCAAAVKPTDLPERTTAASARGASAAWTITAPGEEPPAAALSFILELLSF